MPQISRKILSPSFEQEILNNLYQFISTTRTQEQAKQDISKLFTPTEVIMIAKRLKAAEMLANRKSATEVKNTLNLTYSTIAALKKKLIAPRSEVIYKA